MPWWQNHRTVHVEQANSSAQRESRAPDHHLGGLFNAYNDGHLSKRQLAAQLKAKGVSDKDLRRFDVWVPQ